MISFPSCCDVKLIHVLDGNNMNVYDADAYFPPYNGVSFLLARQ